MADGDDTTTPITQDEADALFDYELCDTAHRVATLITMPVQQYRFDAMVALAYNIGTGRFATSTVRKLTNAGYFDRAAVWFAPWNKVESPPGSGQYVVSAGLTKRRAAERAIYERADYSGRP